MLGECPYDTSFLPVTQGIHYDIDLVYDHLKKSAKCNQKVIWTNHSPDTLAEFRLYMYLNAFKNMKSTFLKDSGGKVFGNDISKRSADDWGWQSIQTLFVDGKDHINKMRYIQPFDGNTDDETILQVILDSPLMPGDSIEIDMTYEAKLPRTIARAGYGLNDYALFVHWFPQMCVYEADDRGIWGWNSHQFMQQTEFYADFSSFQVRLDLPAHLVLGATGCQVDVNETSDGRNVYTYQAWDVIDFAWVVYPLFEKYTHTHDGVDVHLLIPPEHCDMKERYLSAITKSLDYFKQHIAPYPYPSITLVDPPLHTLNSGFMEYPMLITCASFAYVPKGIRTIESLAIHEFSHQFFMGILASNEKESPWLDEGFVTYMEDKIIDFSFGTEGSSLFDIAGYQCTNEEQSRSEYVSLDHDRAGPIVRPGWEIDYAYKGIIYAKTATVLHTLEHMIGEDKMMEVLKYYYETNKFTHPREGDWISAIKHVINDKMLRMPIDTFIYWTLHTNYICDYQVEVIESEESYTEIHLSNNGKMHLPVKVMVEAENGQTQVFEWRWDQPIKSIQLNQKICSVEIDPDQDVGLDINLINNNWYRQKNNKFTFKVASVLSLITSHASQLITAIL